MAEYEALILGIELAKQLKISRLTVHSDSQLIVGQTTEEYTTKNVRIKAYQQLVKGLANGFKYFELKQIPREMNERADQQTCVVSAAQENLRVIEVECLYSPSIGVEKSNVIKIDKQRARLDNPLLEQAQAEDDDCWVTPIVNYLTKGIQPEDHVEARKLRMKAVKYAIFNDTLYRNSLSGHYLRCLNPRQSKWVLRELHDQSNCRTLTICKMGHGHRRLLPRASRNNRFVILTTDYFTKWVEAETYIFVT
ncbi:uncharacterized protein [Malus domestica]|uniref:uncharacterized protein n=1 Tax=Malus domestica TaxID=3750 RepID=UPI003975F6E6